MAPAFPWREPCQSGLVWKWCPRGAGLTAESNKNMSTRGHGLIPDLNCSTSPGHTPLSWAYPPLCGMYGVGPAVFTPQVELGRAQLVPPSRPLTATNAFESFQCAVVESLRRSYPS
jgi:hypothetical protein